MGLILIVEHYNAYRNLQEPALIIAGCFVLVALTLSVFLICQHLRAYNNPAEQKWVVGVLLMVPIYATESIISLWNPNLSLACDILRNCYEAFALYSFGSYLIACLGGEPKVVQLLEADSNNEINKPLLEKQGRPDNQRGRLRNFIFRPSVLGRDLFIIEKFGIVQYMILKTLCAFLAVMLELFGVYGDGEFKWDRGYPYIAVVLNFSQMWALFCLVQFYNATHERLKSIKPLAKFLSFKAIVFATWWQGLGIAILSAYGVLPNSGKFETGLQDFLICIEMAIAAVAHMFVFSAKPYHFLPISDCGKISRQHGEVTMKIEDGKGKQAILEKRETQIEAPGTSVKESVQDIVVEGGQKVVKDVVLTLNQTINQAIEPMEKGMTKIQETFHQISVSSGDNKEADVKVEKHEEKLTGEGPDVLISEEDRIFVDEGSKA
ncbi:transporter [Lithospermum erythrorhizon]|uniref:Transporter n=1 Tax=Lithospermum erythrorhizon TaxID=34254 RepID=A0AAV3QVW6_LITER